MNGCREKRWVLIFLLFFGLGMMGVTYAVVSIDPFFHYHVPKTDTYFYRLSNERSQNDGITRHFQYTGLITGTSVTQNFKTSQAEELFSGTFIKIPFAGATYRETNNAVARALERNPDLKLVIRGLDTEYILSPKNDMASDMGDIPDYLYDEDPVNDIQYILNRDVFFSWTCRMLIEKEKGTTKPGVTGFDEYSSWRRPSYWYGASEVLPDGLEEMNPGEPDYLSEEGKERVLESVRQNMTDIARQYPEVDFIYFIPPESMVRWYERVMDGIIYSVVEAEKIMIEEILKYPNIRFYSWNDRIDITGNLDNYADTVHYGEWINELLLQYIRDGVGLITKENYHQFLENELNTFLTFDYAALTQQKDPR